MRGDVFWYPSVGECFCLFVCLRCLSSSSSLGLTLVMLDCRHDLLGEVCAIGGVSVWFCVCMCVCVKQQRCDQGFVCVCFSQAWAAGGGSAAGSALRPVGRPHGRGLAWGRSSPPLSLLHKLHLWPLTFYVNTCRVIDFMDILQLLRQTLCFLGVVKPHTVPRHQSTFKQHNLSDFCEATVHCWQF